MVHLTRKKRKGKSYLYLEETARVNGKSKRIWQKYLGAEHKIREQVNYRLESEFSIENVDFGLPIALLQIAEELQLVKIINKHITKRNQGISVGNYILFSALNRCVKPTSKNKIRKWFENTALAQKYAPFETYFDAKAYSNHFKYLTDTSIEKIETSLHNALIDQFDVAMNTFFYDPTNFFTYINPKPDQTLPKHGHSKENRFTLNLVGLSLFCTADGGIPVLSKIYPGNIQDAHLFRDEIKHIKKRMLNISKISPDLCLVFDKGNLSLEAFQKIDELNLNFIASVRPTTQKEFHNLKSSDFNLTTLPNGKKVGILEYNREMYGNSRRLIVAFNPNRAKWQGKNLEKKIRAKISEINEFFKGRLNIKKWRDPEVVKKKIKAIIKTKKYVQWIDYKVMYNKGKVSFSVSINEDELTNHYKTLGKSYLMTNHPVLTGKEVVWLFRQQYTVEQAFKYLKNPTLLSVKPIFHQNDESIRGHLFSCVIGLILMLLLGRKIQTQFPEMSLIDITEYLSEIDLSLIQFKNSNKIIKKISQISPEAQKLCKFLNLTAEI